MTGAFEPHHKPLSERSLRRLARPGKKALETAALALDAEAAAEADAAREQEAEAEERGSERAVATEADTRSASSVSRRSVLAGANLLALVTDGTPTPTRASASRALDDEVD